MAAFNDSFNRDGYAIAQNVIKPQQTYELLAAIDALPDLLDVRKKSNVYGVRNLLQNCPAIEKLARSSSIRKYVETVLGTGAFAVRATFFDKVPDANWDLRYHQDTVISVKQRINLEGFYSWATKGDVQQVRPPISVLQRMLAIRVHLDDCKQDNGALRVLVGSHHRKWERAEIADCRRQFEEVTTEIDAGGILAMRPLILHASSASKSPNHRRVIHLEFAADELPGGLEWHRRVA